MGTLVEPESTNGGPTPGNEPYKLRTAGGRRGTIANFFWSFSVKLIEACMLVQAELQAAASEDMLQTPVRRPAMSVSAPPQPATPESQSSTPTQGTPEPEEHKRFAKTLRLTSSQLVRKTVMCAYTHANHA